MLHKQRLCILFITIFVLMIIVLLTISVLLIPDKEQSTIITSGKNDMTDKIYKIHMILFSYDYELFINCKDR